MMLTRTLRVIDRFIEILGLEIYKGKLVEITVKEKKKKHRKKKYKKFFSLCAKINLDEDKINNLRKQSLMEFFLPGPFFFRSLFPDRLLVLLLCLHYSLITYFTLTV
ncbi:MAG: hypothetical protein JSV88_16930 [Candidatus Aminicenantes bacterium]|nr:MAG: hypothetical protein JSV88_16930 [Candidatus Aminicenantes bacterium]